MTATAPRARPRKPAPAPFTPEHFEKWASELVLDTDRPWKLEPFQMAFVEDLFAGFSECWLVIPEGNAKTTLIAGLALYHCEFTPLASVPVGASSREQAEILYRQAEGFVLRSEALHRAVFSPFQVAKGKRKVDVPKFVCLEGHRRINHVGGGRIQVFAADDRTGDGVLPTFAVAEELHRHRDLRLYRTWRGKLIKRHGQIVAISTAGEPGGEFEETRDRIRQTATEAVRDGGFLRAVSSNVVLHEWAVPEDGDVEDFEVVKGANPLKAVTVELLREKRESPTMTLAHWRRFVCNLPTRSEFAAVQETEWFAAVTDEKIPRGTPIWLGLDLGWKNDTTAMVPLWMRERHDRIAGPAAILTPPRDGTTLDPHLVEHAILEIHARTPVHTVVMDPSKGEQLAEWIRENLGAEVVERTQTNAFAAIDYEKFMEALRLGWLKHSGDQGLTRHVLNAIARMLPGGTIRFDRPTPSRNRSTQDRRVIDALTALAMVHATASVEPEKKTAPRLIDLSAA